MYRRIGTGSALLLGMVAFGNTQATACDCWSGCGGYGYGGYGYGGNGYYAAPTSAYYAAPAPAYYAAPAPAYYAAPAPAYAAPAPAYYADPGYAADARPPVSHPSARYYAAAAPNHGYEGYAHASYRHLTQPVDGGKWDQSASMLGGPRKNIIPVANPSSQRVKATVASHGGAQNKALAAGKSTLAVSPPTAKNGRLAKLPQNQQALASGGISMSSPSRYGKPGVRHMAADPRGE
jgi:hypothetical protein